MRKLATIIFLLASLAAAQTPSGTTVEFQNGGTLIFTGKKFIVVNCSTGMSCSYSAGIVSLAATSSGGAFSSLTGGTNTSAAMLVGTGASLAPTGSGTISANQLNGTNFSGTNGDVVSFGAANIPADSGVVAANVVTSATPGAGVAHFGGSTQIVTSSPVVGADMGAAISMGQTTSTLVNTTRLTSNYTSSNASATVLFTIPLAGSTAATYWIDCYGTYSQATTATSQQLSFTSVTTGATEVDASNLVSTQVATIRTGANNLAAPGTANTNFGATFTLGAAGNIQPWQAHLVVTQPSGTASNFQILWASTTGNTDVTTVYENSHCTWASTAN